MDSCSCLRQIVSEALSAKSTPYIIGIGGGAGVGKTTFADSLKNALEQECKKVLVMHLDDFFKSPEERRRLGTEWDENHINLAGARRVLESAKRGDAEATKQRYDRATGKIEQEQVDMSGADIIIFEGIYAISSEKRLGNFLEFIDLPVYLSAEIEDIRKWRFAQEAEKPHPRSLEHMEMHWKSGILPDLQRNVMPSKKNARFVINVDSNHGLSIAP